jgi:thiamine biosynthesis lipoprotein
MQTVTLARHAMATRFELVLHGDSATSLRAAGEEALDEIDRLENQLSLYRPGSEIAQLNAHAAREPVRVTPTLFALLQHAQRLHAESGGAFDITIAPLVRCWGFMGGTGKMPAAEEIADARARIGMQHLELDAQNYTVRFARDGVMLDLGAIGKGYAVGQAAEILRETGVTSALIHGGTSTVYAIGHPPEAEFWKIAIEKPPLTPTLSSSDGEREKNRCADEDSFSLSLSERERAGVRVRSSVLVAPSSGGWPGTVPLRDEAMSVSAVWGRFFEADGKMLGHVIDPRNGQPVNRAFLTVVVLPSATETDALSTALLVLGAEGHDSISKLRPGMRTLLVTETDGVMRTETRGLQGGGAHGAIGAKNSVETFPGRD